MRVYLSFLMLLFFGCASRKPEHEVATLALEIDTEPYVLSYELHPKDGFALILSDQIEEQVGLSSGRSAFRYISKRDVAFKLKNKSDWLSFSSFNGKKIRSISNYVIGFVDPKKWTQTSFDESGTTFHLITKKNSLIDHLKAEASIRLIWKEFVKMFGTGTDVVTFIELDWAPLSGGPLGENVLGLFYQSNVSSDTQKQIEKELGWTPRASTAEYISTYYGPNGWDEYLTGTLAHELAHVYFGFGKTGERVKEPHELWFSLGLGLVYDIEITRKLTGKNPQLFVDSAKVWNSFSLNKEIDQRLINPSTSNDSKFQLDRKKVYAHSKAHAFLSVLRKRVGENDFDSAVRRYLRDCSQCEDGYQDFLKFLAPKHRPVIRATESWFKI